MNITKNGQKVECYGDFSPESAVYAVFDDEMFDNYVDVEEHWERWSDVVSDVTAYAERVGTTVVELTCD